MKILNISKEDICPKIWKGENNYYGVSPGGGNGLLGYLIHQKALDGENGVNSILNGIKNVKVTEEEFEVRKKHDDEIRVNDFKDYDWDFDNNAMYWHLQDVPENFTEEQLSTIPYNWGDGEVYHADSYADITEVHNNDLSQIEYYSTPEVIEVLERWKEALEKWNNLEERKKMIEEYEKENTKS